MKIGKLSNAELEELVLSKFIQKRKEVVLPPGVGLDCCVVNLGEELCVLSTDPITAASEKIGFIAVNVCCNDAAAAGAEPIGVLTTLLLPTNIIKSEIEQIANDIQSAANIIGIDVLGGHTEITNAVNRPIISVTVVAKTINKNVLDPTKIRAGDVIIMTKTAAIEGSAIICADFEHLAKSALTKQEIQTCKALINNISVVAEGLCGAKNNAIAMHDITEGGVLGAVWEMATAAGLGIAIESSKIPITAQTKKLCAALNIDPFKLVSSGSMLICVSKQHCENLQKELQKQGIQNTIIGSVVNENITIDNEKISPPTTDELYKL